LYCRVLGIGHIRFNALILDFVEKLILNGIINGKSFKNTVLLAKNKEHFCKNSKKSYFLTKYRISAQNWIRVWKFMYAKYW